MKMLATIEESYWYHRFRNLFFFFLFFICVRAYHYVTAEMWLCVCSGPRALVFSGGWRQGLTGKSTKLLRFLDTLQKNNRLILDATLLIYKYLNKYTHYTYIYIHIKHYTYICVLLVNTKTIEEFCIFLSH